MWDGIYKVGALLVSLVTAGLVPYLISQNTKQHKNGSTERKNNRDEVTKLIEEGFRSIIDLKQEHNDLIIQTVKEEIHPVKQGLGEVKKEVDALKILRLEYKKDVHNLLERIIKNEK